LRSGILLVNLGCVPLLEVIYFLLVVGSSLLDPFLEVGFSVSKLASEVPSESFESALVVFNEGI
jgi:hypothetical protein